MGGGGKETPRQKMVGMMYLVLTALLAMNVSKDILDAFIIINDGIEVTNANFESKNKYTYNAFEKAFKNDPLKVRDYYTRAKNARDLADGLDDYIDEQKKFIISKTEGIIDESILDTITLKYCPSKDNYDVPTYWMIGEDAANPIDSTVQFSAAQLKHRIEKYNRELTSLIDDPVRRAGMKLGLETEDFGMINGTFETWETGNFYHLPLAAVITTLTKIQSDVRNAEATVIKELYSNISADDFKFDTLAAKVIPNTNYVILGDTYRADVFVAAFSTTQNPQLVVGTEFDSSGYPVGGFDSTGVSVGRGVANYKLAPKTEGPVEWGGVIKIKKPDGQYQPFTFKSSFIAAKPTVVVSPTAMNVFYRGLENPVDISVPGIPTDQLKVNMNNGSIVGSKGKFKVKPGKGKDCTINVSADIGGKSQSFGKALFRVKNVPDPKPYFAGLTGGGRVPKKKLLVAQGVIAKMENFEFDLKFTVVSYKMSATIKGNVVEQVAKGNRVTSNMKSILKALKTNQKVYIEAIKAKGPDGSVRNLGNIVIEVG